ncbi:phosphoinositide 3-kinase regulatory subunit 4 [Trichonephila clavipes]|nr:phosphoinositide 3-kinase regulatory subunit 4 [Trichonephila clavipes]
MLFGSDLCLPADLLFSRPPDAPLAPEEYVEKLQAWMEEMHCLARNRIGMISEKMKIWHNARTTGHYFHKGDKVWLWNPQNVIKDSLQSCRPTGKILILLRLIDGTEVICEHGLKEEKGSLSDDVARRYPETPPVGHYDCISAIATLQTTQPLILSASKDGVVKVWK